MATVLTPTYNFSRNLARKSDECTATAADMAHDQNDNLYWKVWVIDIRSKLAKLVDADQLTDYIREIQPLTPFQQYLKIARQIELEEAHRLADSTCTCWEIPSGTAFVCPVCQAMAEGQEIPY